MGDMAEMVYDEMEMPDSPAPIELTNQTKSKIMKTSKVKSKQANGDWNSDKYGLFYKWEIEMENGDVGNALTKDDQGKSYQVGEMIDYEFTDGDHPKIKRVATEGAQNRSKGSSGGNGSFALSYAKDAWVAGKIASQEEYFKLADANKKWLDENK